MDAVLTLTKKVALVTIGTACLAIGVLGLLLPVLPGTPFLIMSALCFGLAFEDQGDN